MIIAKIAFTSALVCTTFLPANNLELPDTTKKEMLASVNNLRTKGCKCGNKYMPPVNSLSWNDRLENAAFAHAYDMYRKDFFSHKGSNGSSISARIKRAGYDWGAAGENISWGYDSFEDTMEGWIDSPGHCRNMMSSDFTEMGAAKVGRYWVQDFGAKRWMP